MAKSKNPKEPIVKSPDEAAKALEVLFATDYVDKKKLYTQNFLRGLFFGFGSLVGATLVITLLIWILSLFDSIPVIGPYIEDTKQTIKEEKPQR
jgi:hypothetical protein